MVATRRAAVAVRLVGFCGRVVSAPPVPSASPRRFPDRFPAAHYTYERWIWAFTMLFSRAIRLRNLRVGERLAMVPYADLINHSAYSGSFLDARESGDWLFKDGEEEVILYADRGYRQVRPPTVPGLRRLLREECCSVAN